MCIYFVLIWNEYVKAILTFSACWFHGKCHPLLKYWGHQHHLTVGCRTEVLYTYHNSRWLCVITGRWLLLNFVWFYSHQACLYPKGCCAILSTDTDARLALEAVMEEFSPPQMTCPRSFAMKCIGSFSEFKPPPKKNIYIFKINFFCQIPLKFQR